jgi:DNA-binding transcriptional ArsR family regulator
VLRIIFTSEDLARVRLSAAPDPLWELVLSIHMLRGQPGDLLFTGWRARTGRALGVRRLGASGRLLSDLTPTLGYFPDFLNPAAAIDGLDAGLEAIRSTPIAIIERDLGRMAVPGRSAANVAQLAAGDPRMLERLTITMRAYYEVAISPYQAVIQAAVERDRRIQMQVLSDGGVRGLFAGLRPLMAYSGGELRIAGHSDQVIHLGGRGLTLVPSYFCVRHPVTLFDGDLPPVLIYPATAGFGPLEAPGGGVPNRQLNVLIGNTRAAVLATVGFGCSTADLARRLRVSAPTASEHAGVLRAAGLIVSHRDGPYMIHQITELGLALLNGAPG